MKQIIGKSCRLTVKVGREVLFYTVKEVLEVTDTHILFIDKFGQEYSYRLADIMQIQGIK